MDAAATVRPPGGRGLKGMTQATSGVQDLTRFLLKCETEQSPPSEEEGDAALRALGKIRTYLTKVVGIAGFQALLTRALALAAAEVVWLEAVSVQADATLQGFEEAAHSLSAQTVAAGGTALLEQLLGLLITFIGEALTLRLVQDIWPQSQSDNSETGTKEISA